MRQVHPWRKKVLSDRYRKIINCAQKPTKISNVLFAALMMPLLLLPAQAYATELFYEDCKDTSCVKAYISQKAKISEGQYRITAMYLNYKNRGSNTADEETKTAKVNCDKNSATVTWGSNKPQKIDKSVFPKAMNDKKGKASSPAAIKKYDESTSLWKAICPVK